MLSARLLAFQQGMLQMCRSQFPKRCNTCGKSYPSFKSYVETVVPIGTPIPDQIEGEDPIGLMSLADCPCGNTLSLVCEDLSGDTHRAFNQALKLEALETGRSTEEILAELRGVLRAEAVRSA